MAAALAQHRRVAELTMAVDDIELIQMLTQAFQRQRLKNAGTPGGTLSRNCCQRLRLGEVGRWRADVWLSEGAISVTSWPMATSASVRS
ncbi:hypothetical protein HORIV_03740 [Vreelandella olivaria]|uniref:Uncharacterized protein n=1 Tax=Vreelandella olivaria TaxID=390919 RepID=A0ABN5WSV3_9GAMM|nr:hypothetical protein HORIV_03740 [Halomonas olivaria]